MKQFLILIATITFIVTGCSPNNPPTSNGQANIKYEIITSSPAASNSSFQTQVEYVNSYGQNETSYNQFPGGQSRWIKSIQLLTDNRPIALMCAAIDLQLVSPGRITCNIYVDGILKSSASSQTSEVGNNINYVSGGVSYIYN